MKVDELKCEYCGNEMFLDDIDYNFKGCYDNYFFCGKCGARAVEKVRYGKRFTIEWLESTETVTGIKEEK